MPASIYNYTPQYAALDARPLTRAFVAWIAVAVVALLFVGVLFLAPLLAAGGSVVASKIIYQGFSMACHQQPARSFHAWGHPLAVCARCTASTRARGGRFTVAARASLKHSYAPARKWLSWRAADLA